MDVQPLRLLCLGVLGVLAVQVTGGCFPHADDGDPADPGDWTFDGAEDVILAGTTSEITLDGPRKCTDGAFGIGGSCTFSTIQEISSSDPGVVAVEGEVDRVLRLRAGTPGTATITVVGTTPDNEPTEGSVTIRVAAAAHAALEVYTGCGEAFSLDQLAFPPETSLGLGATFQDAAGHTLVGDGTPPFALDPMNAGAIEGQLVDGHTDFVSLRLAYDVSADEVGLTLLDGTELQRFAIANGNTIDGFEMGETTFNPNFNEVYVRARLAVGDRHICFDEYDYPQSLEYDVEILTLDVCDAGFGDESTRGVAGFALTANTAGDCVVTLHYGSLTKTLTIPVVPAN